MYLLDIIFLVSLDTHHRVDFLDPCCCSVIQTCPTPCSQDCSRASLSFTVSRTLHKPMSIELRIPSNHLILCHPLLSPSVFPSIGAFSSELSLPIRWPKYWSFSFSSSPSNEHPGLISFRMDWLDLLAAQGTPKSSQHHSSKASTLRHSAFSMVQLSHLHVTVVSYGHSNFFKDPLYCFL